MAFYAGWSQAVKAGHDQSERYFAAHLYPGLPKCVPGEKVLPIYTAQRETIQRADEWTISWGPLDGVRPAGRVYEVQLSERESPSHVSVLFGVAYVFWNCRGYVATDSFEVDQDVRYPEPLGGSDGAYGSGCSPGAGTLPDGVWFVVIQAATASEITFDVACLRPDERGDTWPVLVTNDAHTLRTSRVSPYAVTYVVAEGYQRDLQWAAMAYPQWLTDPPPSIVEELCWYSGCRGAWLYINDGAITAIVQGVFQI
jgi:hypothetical protein